MVNGAGLENQCTLPGTGGSNPSLSVRPEVMDGPGYLFKTGRTELRLFFGAVNSRFSIFKVFMVVLVCGERPKGVPSESRGAP